MAALAGLLAAAVPADEPSGTDAWEVIYQFGARVGYQHTHCGLDPRDASRVVTDTDTEFTMRHLTRTVRSQTHQHFVETVDGQALEFACQFNSPGSRSGMSGVFRDGHVEVTETAGNASRTLNAPLDARQVEFPHAQAVRMQAQEFKPGARFERHVLYPELGMKVQTIHYEVLGRQNVDVLDHRADLWRVRVTMDSAPDVETVEFLDDHGQSWRQENPATGLTVIRGTPELAMAPLDLADIPDTLLNSSVRPNLSFYRPRHVTRARYRITVGSGHPPSLPGGYQTVESQTSDEVVLRVEPPALPAQGSASAQRWPEYLRSNAYIHCGAEPVLAVVRQTLGHGSLSDAQKVLRLRAWVRSAISCQSMDVAFGTDLETLQSRCGDCTEYAVLLASLCRAAGIPARVATGIVYAGGVFMGHCWTEVALGDSWVPVDAALGTDQVDATHIKLSDSSLNEPGVEAELGNTVNNLGRLRVEVLAYEERGHEIATGLAQPRLQGDEVDWPSFGVHLRIPPGWTWVSAENLPYPACLALRSRDGRHTLTMAAQEYLGTDFAATVDLVGKGLTEPRLEKRVDGHRAVLLLGGGPGKRDVSLLIDRRDAYLSLQLIAAPDAMVTDFMAVVDSLRLTEP